MQTMMRRSTPAASFVALAVMLATLGACGKEPRTSASTSAATTTTSTAIVPAPVGDSTPKAADTMAAPAMPQNEKTGSTEPSTVGTAASGAPPYSMQGAPEGNPAPSQGSKPADTRK